MKAIINYDWPPLTVFWLIMTFFAIVILICAYKAAKQMQYKNYLTWKRTQLTYTKKIRLYATPSSFINYLDKDEDFTKETDKNGTYYRFLSGCERFKFVG